VLKSYQVWLCWKLSKTHGTGLTENTKALPKSFQDLLVPLAVRGTVALKKMFQRMFRMFLISFLGSEASGDPLLWRWCSSQQVSINTLHNIQNVFQEKKNRKQSSLSYAQTNSTLSWTSLLGKELCFSAVTLLAIVTLREHWAFPHCLSQGSLKVSACESDEWIKASDCETLLWVPPITAFTWPGSNTWGSPCCTFTEPDPAVTLNRVYYCQTCN